MNLRERAEALRLEMGGLRLPASGYVDPIVRAKVEAGRARILRAFREVAREAAWRGVRAGVSMGARGEGDRDEEARDAILANMEAEAQPAQGGGEDR